MFVLCLFFLLVVASRALAITGQPSCADVGSVSPSQCSNGNCGAVCDTTCTWRCGADVACTLVVEKSGTSTSYEQQCIDEATLRPRCGDDWQPTGCPNGDCNAICSTGCQFTCVLGQNTSPCKLIVEELGSCVLCGQENLSQECCQPPCSQTQSSSSSSSAAAATTGAGGGGGCTTVQQINCANMLACTSGQEPQCFCDPFGIDTDLSYCGTPVTTGFGFSPAPSGPTTGAGSGGGGDTTTTSTASSSSATAGATNNPNTNPNGVTTTAGNGAVAGTLCANQQLCDQWQGTPICVGGTCTCTADQVTVLSRSCPTTIATAAAGMAGECDETRRTQCVQALKCEEDQTAVCLCNGASISNAYCSDSAGNTLKTSAVLFVSLILSTFVV